MNIDTFTTSCIPGKSGHLNLAKMSGIFKFPRTMSLKRLLIDAMSNDEFELVYQPQTEISGQHVIGVEALLRWHSPEYGLISPTKFIPIAEELGLISDLGNMVIEKACCQAAEWEKKYASTIRMAVNVSYMQVHSLKMVEYVDLCLSKHNIKKNALEIELTESSLVKDITRVIEVLSQLNELGVRTAIDDFGTGYSSLSHLACMPFDLIKIDKSFISLLGKNQANTAITEAIIQMSKKLDMEVLAEGVETIEQLNILKNSSCDLIQGNLISRPVSAEVLPDVVGMYLC